MEVADTSIEELESRMTSIEGDLSIIKQDLQMVLQSLSRARGHCSFLRLTDDD